MPWGALIGAAGTYLAGRSANKGAQKGADAQAEANRLAVEEQRRQFDLTREDMAPWMEAGKGALGRLTGVSGGDFSQFTESPDYQWRFGEGMKTLDRSAASRGSLFGGGTDLDRMGFGQGLASSEFGNWWNRQSGLAGTGQTTAGQLGQFGANSASNIGNLLQNSGQARASSYQQQGNNNAQLWGALAGGINQFGQGRGWWGG